MASKPAEGAEVKPKSKKKLLIIIAAVLLVLVLAAGAALFFLMKGSGDEDLDEAETSQSTKQAKPRTPPEYMALDPVVINLADAGMIRYAQVGITLQVDTKATSELIKPFLPSIRNGILRQISRRTAPEILLPEGKDQLAQDILELVRQETGLGASAKAESPVQAVLFSSLIVQ